MGNSSLILPALERNQSHKQEGEAHFSYSQLNMYNRCGQQYKYRYDDGLIQPPNLKMGSGKAIHEALEYNAKHKMRVKEDMPIEQVLDTAATAHDKFMAEVEDLDRKAAGKDKDESQSIVGLYRRQQAPTITPLAAEYEFRIVLEEDETGFDYRPVIGYIDAASELPDPRDGPTKNQRIIAVEDYKKVGQKKSQLEVDISPQLTLYDYVYTLHTEGEVPDVIGLRQLGFNGPRAQSPGPYSIPIYRSPEYHTSEARTNRHKRVLNQLKQAQRAIQAGVFIAVDDPRVCSWCGYRDICQVKPEV